MVQDTTGKRIQVVRKKLNKSQEDFGILISNKIKELSSIDECPTPKRQTISAWESDVSFPSLLQLKAISLLTSEYDIGYLLCLYDSDNYEADKIHKHTGLSSAAIRKLSSWKSDPDSLSNSSTYISFINLLIESPKIEKAFDSLARYKFLMDLRKDNIESVSNAFREHRYEAEQRLLCSDDKYSFIKSVYQNEAASIHPSELLDIVFSRTIDNFKTVLKYMVCKQRDKEGVKDGNS